VTDQPRRRFTVERIKRRAGATPAAARLESARACSTLDLQLVHELEQLADRIGRIPAMGRNGDLEPFYAARSQARKDAMDIARWQRDGSAPDGFVPAAGRDRSENRRTNYGERH